MIVFYNYTFTDLYYILPIFHKTGGTIVTSSKACYDHLLSNYSKKVIKFGNIEYCYDLDPKLIITGQFFKTPKEHKRSKVKKVHIFHGYADKNYIYARQNYIESPLYIKKVDNFLKEHGFEKICLLDEKSLISKRISFMNVIFPDIFQLLLVPGPFVEKKLIENNIVRSKGKNWKKIGFPRFDMIINDEIDKEGLKRSFDIQNENITILYAPTWRGHGVHSSSSIPKFLLSLCDRLPKNINLLIKPHPNVETGQEFKDIWDKFNKIIQEKEEQIKYIPQQFDILKIMSISDLLLTDFSTVGMEYLIFNRPIIFLDHLGKEFIDDGLIEYRYRVVGDIVYDPKRIFEVIDKNLKDPNAKEEHRKRYRDHFFYFNDGRSSERAAKAIMGLLEEEE